MNLELQKDRAFIGGQWVAAGNGRRYAVHNPADGGVIAEVPDMDRHDAQKAIAAAGQSLPGWSAKTARERGAVLRRWHDLILLHREALARIITAECGKPLAEAQGEVGYGAAFIEWFAEEGKRACGEVIPTHGMDKRLLTLKQPVGVCAAITPWNFPIAMITRKAGPALAAGCGMVVKPAEATPLTALALAALAEQAALPAGVLNIVTAKSGVEVGREFCANPLVRKLSFTGSTATGKILLKQCADTVKRVSMELGGNAPFIVFEDAELDAAVAGAMASKYRNTGQTCVCANRFLVQAGVYDAFAERLATAVAGLKVGHGHEAGVTQGPLINIAGLEKVEAQVEDAVARGAGILCGGARHALGGNFFQPTVLTGVTPGMRIAREETFGPVAPLFRFNTEQEAIAMANDTEFGLAAYFYSRDVGRIMRVAEALEYGMVGANEGIISTEAAPFGGVKQSGLGREGSRHGIEEYLETKYLCLGGMRVNPD